MRVHTSDIPKTYEYILFFLLLLGMFVGVDKRDDEEYPFSYSGLRVKYPTA